MTERDILGAWALVSFDLVSADGAVSAWGQNRDGMLLYSPTCHMSVSIRRDTATEHSGDWDSLDDFLFCAGTFSIDAAAQIQHHVKIATERGRDGKNLIREVSSKNGRLHIPNAIPSGGKAKLVWKRAIRPSKIHRPANSAKPNALCPFVSTQRKC